MTEYETIFIVRPEWTTEQVRQFADRLTAMIEKAKGVVFHMREVARRKLSYPVKKQSKGAYIYASYAGGGNLVAEIERTLRLEEDVLKFLTVKGETLETAESVEARRAKSLEEETRLAMLFGAGSDAPAAPVGEGMGSDGGMSDNYSHAGAL